MTRFVWLLTGLFVFVIVVILVTGRPTLDWVVGVTDLFNIGLTLLLALGVGVFLERDRTRRDSQRELLRDHIKATLSTLSELHRDIQEAWERGSGSPSMLARLKALSADIHLLLYMVNNLGLTCRQVMIDQIQSSPADYRKASTSGAFPSGPLEQSEFIATEALYARVRERLIDLYLKSCG